MISSWILQNWQRKAIALVTAVIVWVFVNHSIIETKTIPNVPIRIINLSPEKTVIGLLPNGILKKRVTLTVSGSRNVIADLEPGDLEVEIDASMIDHDEWIVRITKKNLVSLNPSLDLAHHITNVSHNEFVLKMTRVVTAKVPVTLKAPIGEAPKGYEFLDIWPMKFMQTVSGPAEEVQQLILDGIEITFDLNKITKEDIDNLRKIKNNPHDDVIGFPVPNNWKKIPIDFRNNAYEEINDPEVDNLKIYFLLRQILPIDRVLPIRVFYPLEYSEKMNPETFKLALGGKVEKRNGINIYTSPLFLRDVSRLFLEVVRDNIEICIIAAPKSKREVLEWSAEVIDPLELEDTFVAYMIANKSKEVGVGYGSKQWEGMLRKRFRKYLERITLFVTSNQKLSLETVVEDNQIKVK